MPSIVVISLSPTPDTGIEQDRNGLPSICTVQAPHWAMPQPNLVPVNCRLSRNTQSSGVSGSTSTEWDLPFTLIEKAAIDPSKDAFRQRHRTCRSHRNRKSKPATLAGRQVESI